MNAIDRTPLRDQVYRALVGRILTGEHPPGSRMSDRGLAETLDVSRTPIREALMRMERERLLESDPHRGFFVRDLTVDEVEEIYPVIAILEGGLVRRSGATRRTIARLRELNGRLERSADDAFARVDLDMLWHETLTHAASNPYADDLLAATKILIRRYEYAYMREAGHVPLSVRMHEDICAALETGDADAAAGLLEDHWRFGMDAVRRWLQPDAEAAGEGAAEAAGEAAEEAAEEAGGEAAADDGTARGDARSPTA